MHIEGIQIDGFGRFAGQRFGPLDPRLTLIIGPNEAGKSTLLSFVYTVLFGFSQRKDPALIPPLAGGRHGGSLRLRDDRGEWYTVTRHAGPNGGALTVTLPDGKPGNADTLARLLADIPADAYRNLFGFGLDQLQTLPSLDGPQVGLPELPKVVAAFGRQASDLFGPNAWTRPVGKKIEALGQLDQDLAEAIQQAGRHPQLQQRRDEIERELSQIATHLHMAQEEQRRVQRLLDGWPLGVRLNVLRERLSQAPEAPRFPEEGLARLEQAETAARSARLEAEAAQREREQARSAVQEPVPDVALLERHEAVRRLKAGRAGFGRAVAELPSQRAELAVAEARLREEVQQLGAGWDLDRIAAADVSLPARDALRSHREELARTRQELREAAAQAAAREADWRAAVAEAERAAARVPEAPAFNREWLAARRAALAAALAQQSEVEAHRRTLDGEQRNLAALESAPLPEPQAASVPPPPSADRQALAARRSALGRARADMARLETRRQQLDEERRLLTALEEQAQVPVPVASRLNAQWLPLAVAVAGVVSIAGGLLGGGLPLAGVGVVLLALAAYLLRSGAAAPAPAQDAAALRLADQRMQVAAAAGSVDQAVQVYAVAVRALGLTADADAAALDRVEAQIDAEALALQQWELGQRDRTRTAEDAVQRRQERIAEQRERVAAALAALDRETTLLRSAIQAVGLPATADAAMLATAETALEAGRASLERWEQAVQERTRLEEQVQRLQALYEHAAGAHQRAAAAGEEAEAAWRGWLAAQGLAEGLNPEGAAELLSSVETARRAAGEIAVRRERVSAVEQEVTLYRDALADLARGLNEPPPPSDLAAAGVFADRLADRFDAAAEAAQRRRQLDERLAEAEANLERRRGRWRAEQANLEQLLALADAPDPESFRLRARLFDERRALERELSDCVEQVQTLVGAGEALAVFLDALAVADQGALRDRLEELKAGTQELGRRRDALQQEQGRVQAESESLERNGGAAALQARRYELVEQLRGDAEQWVTATLSQLLLTRTLRRFEEERQPTVVREAQSFYGAIVARPEVRLHVPLGERRLEVIDSQGRRSPEQLSRGTREQLYLALRFGQIREMGAGRERLPVLVDDVLVNFDPERARRSAEAFAQLSETNQVLVFTCHPETAEMFRSVIPNAPVIDLAAASR